MRIGILIVTLFLALGFAVRHSATSGTSSTDANTLASFSLTSPAKKPDFETQIKPIFKNRCQPCHFQGGQMYEKMPFDKSETITTLGEKLFTRIKDTEEQRVIREFLSQP